MTPIKQNRLHVDSPVHATQFRHNAGVGPLPPEVNGTRNDTMARIVGHLLRHGVEPELARTLVISFNCTNCQPPLGDDEVEQVIQSIAQREALRRGANG
jgi:Primase C terminal 1 (PriCT-1)